MTKVVIAMSWVICFLLSIHHPSPLVLFLGRILQVWQEDDLLKEVDRLDWGIGSGCRAMKLVIKLMCHFWKTEVAGYSPPASTHPPATGMLKAGEMEICWWDLSKLVTAITISQQSPATQLYDGAAGHLWPRQQMTPSPTRLTLVSYRAVRAGVCCPFLEEMCYRSILQKPGFSAITPDWQAFLCCDQ